MTNVPNPTGKINLAASSIQPQNHFRLTDDGASFHMARHLAGSAIRRQWLHREHLIACKAYLSESSVVTFEVLSLGSSDAKRLGGEKERAVLIDTCIKWHGSAPTH